jgi:outer membrane protein OmpA-like peptidoglycan-associated protein
MQNPQVPDDDLSALSFVGNQPATCGPKQGSQTRLLILVSTQHKDIPMQKKTLVPPLLAALLLSACATNDLGDSRELNKTETGAIIGTVSGAALGAIINHNNRGKGALIGAVGGGLTGAGVGYYMDQQAKDLQKQLQPEIQRGDISIEKRSDNALLVSMTASTGFDTDSSVLKPGYLPTLNKIARVLNQYGKTTVTVIGHTDSVGTHEYNQALSERRAQSVRDYFAGQNVNSLRLESYGRGETGPRADNNTDAGRQLNRRVELWIQPVIAG